MKNLMRRANKKFLLLLLTIIIGICVSGCRSSKHTKEKVKVGEIEVKIEEPKKNKTKENIFHEEVLSWLGTPYKYGASEKGIFTDCSGMVMVVYENIFDIKLPRNSAKQAEFCNKLSEKNVKSGDLVFFATGRDEKKISHVGIMIDAIRFVHASSSKGVIISEITTPYYQRTFKMFGRVPGISW